MACGPWRHDLAGAFGLNAPGTRRKAAAGTNPEPHAPELPAELAVHVVAWQGQQGRTGLPWQDTTDPYRVWLSEIMLQQTQVKTVLGYFDAFLRRFPNVQALAAAPLDDVLSAWSGLGYYSRARNLHACAQQVVQVHGGVFPGQAAALAQLPGIGRSTAAAIAAFCFGEHAAILDGNVKRVLTRVAAWGADLARAPNERALWVAATAALPTQAEDLPAYTQGIMDLGATVCLTRQPRCAACPLNSLCRAHAAGAATRYPVKTRRLKRSARSNAWLWLQDGQGRVWLQQRAPRGVWAGLWTLPLLDHTDNALAALEQMAPGTSATCLPPVQHALTHFDWTLQPVRCLVADPALAPETMLGDGRWFTQEAAMALGLPAPLRKLLQGTP